MREHNGKFYTENTPHDMAELLEVVSVLRSEKGCEWDRAQTHETLKKCLTDEAQEVLDAIDNKDDENLCEELGDLLLQVVMNAQVASERGAFTFKDVLQVLVDKLIRRHPHVFGDEERPTTPEESLALWRKVKEKEKALKSQKQK
jgi:MazG family protein